MKKILALTILSVFILSCKGEGEGTEGTSNGDSEEVARLKSEMRVLEDQLAEKDSVINETMMLFNEIEQNLAMINLKEDEIRFKSNDIELEEDGKQWILQEIQNINYLREENTKKVKELNKSLENKNLQIEELQNMITSLMDKIQVQEEEIEMLRVELADLDREYVELLEAYEEQTMITAQTLQELNKAYYAYGSTKELEANGVIVREGGFLGMKKRTELADNMNDEYFTPIDITRTKTIQITGEKVKFVTDHPSSAYEVVSTGENHTIKINDPKSFWKVSKYLVVVVD
ncbi:hypothetical protein K6119_04420 [Paracrocinitomix mangrovi]|uniref:Cbp1 family collagen-binding glycoprotein adhesin n=1 Tax=Paracrocinitomix mangrovi TaxID=2862509 RepID=UPI001C8D2035|nr:hypothetical protein [Paracrocinitomix mangrovi]UKN02759.1 hypothetical protein K6119_04420 [Paracrocinitomix mangrovi]